MNLNKYNIKEVEDKLNRCRNMKLEEVDEISSIKIDKRKNSTEWSYEQVNKCIEVFDKNFKGYRIDTNNITIGFLLKF